MVQLQLLPGAGMAKKPGEKKSNFEVEQTAPHEQLQHAMQGRMYNMRMHAMPYVHAPESIN
jgi:hypothetical protein